ncbi:aromatic amino acid DMT transporter YddG [Acerihabitans sp. TG2]|uniref:aromatic amino acid DMT transporter YddG n=1 Tax=Acerihabitans sp. TG2 TaxID=3096008 RepID=UPI002B23AA86|nr:aromatic amino acid DMT transporter YddG [Acerihabitans sp. TG2]MEA9391326.1 aromatic amino acid DMT transporter YddG [Acerihabitans sp. TG2]
MFSASPQSKATMLGLLAILLWSSSVGLLRSVSESLGPIGGAAIIYSVSAVMLLVLMGFPALRTFPRAYLLGGGILFASYEIFLSLALGYANDRAQAIEIGMVNYLWPSFTILLAVVFNGEKANGWIVPGLLLCLYGIGWIMGGDGGWSLERIGHNILSNPLSYGLAFFGAIIWAAYCNVTKRWAQGKDGVTLFFILTALTLWVQYAFSHEPIMRVDFPITVRFVLAGAASAVAYAAWNSGIMRGNLMLLATASYFTPVLSSLVAGLVLNTPLTLSFWLGVVMVTAGSLLCWHATRRNKTRPA